MKKYEHNKIEKKWQKVWQKSKIYKTDIKKDKPKCYVLDMFPYPSGSGLHVGHPKGYIATDVYSRYKRMNGFNILHPMGWDAFGLPAEEYAIKNKMHPSIAVNKNIKTYKEQLSKIGFNYDWEREINTTDPKYFKWTQWIFLQMFKKGLAYESFEPINWCPTCQTGLANEDLEDGKCERCSSVIEKKPMRQWVLKITDYADRLLKDLDELNWPESIKESQRNWIGRSEGSLIKFPVLNSQFTIEVFTTRADTLFGATYVVIAPEHPLVLSLKEKISNWDDVMKYITATKNKSEIERTSEGKEKTGVQLKGIKAKNPVNGDELPVFIGDYVLAHYGTGAIMAVPAHDDRDFDFAKKHNLPIKQVIEPENLVVNKRGNLLEKAFTGEGVLINSQNFDGMRSKEVKLAITEKFGNKKVTYKIRDWVFSRQRYWGEPIPIIHCEKCGAVPVPEKDLPVKLPNVKSYAPTGTGESPLSAITKWVNVKCPNCKGPAKRETNTMPQWAGSSWYHLRYIDSKNQKELVDKNKDKYWSPVDMYVGGTEHATRHLIYARFWHKFLFDIEAINYSEPYKQLKNQGLILGSDGRKMSKRWGNVINPDDVVAQYGADTLRVYEMFMGPFENMISWSTESMIGSRRFLEKIWRMQEKASTKQSPEQIEKLLHKTVKKVTEDIESFSFNTAISAMMIFLNEVEKNTHINKKDLSIFLKILSPFAPHITEEMWNTNNKTKKSIHISDWPKYDPSKITEEFSNIAIQINGKVRDILKIATGSKEEEIREKALELESVKKWLVGKDIKKILYIKDKILSIVI
ncbi:MAG: leucine--tRNA ligase [Candidatus Paceibacterota bacterium]